MYKITDEVYVNGSVDHTRSQEAFDREEMLIIVSATLSYFYGNVFTFGDCVEKFIITVRKDKKTLFSHTVDVAGIKQLIWE